MDMLHINWENMDEFSEIPIGYRFIDKVEVIPGVKATGIKAVSSLDWYFKIHFPGNPIVPGVFLMEAMQQTGMFIITTLPETKEKLMLFQGCKNMRMYKSVRPGDIIKTDVQLRTYRHGIADFDGKLYIQEGEKETLACAMSFTQIIRSQLPQIKAPETCERIDDKCLTGGYDIDWQSIDSFIADPIQYRFVDKIKTDKASMAVGIKLASSLDWYFEIFPADPIMPTGLLMEAAMQTGVFTVTTAVPIEKGLMMFQSCKTLQIYDVIRPGDILQTQARLKSYRRGIATLDGYLWKDGACIGEMTYTLIAPGEIAKYKI